MNIPGLVKLDGLVHDLGGRVTKGPTLAHPSAAEVQIEFSNRYRNTPIPHRLRVTVALSRLAANDMLFDPSKPDQLTKGGPVFEVIQALGASGLLHLKDHGAPSPESPSPDPNPGPGSSTNQEPAA